MATIDTLTILDGYIDGKVFMLRGLAGYAVKSRYNVEGISSLARLIDSRGEEFILTIDRERQVMLTVAQSLQLRKELLALAEELEDN
ncbi:hypothetical protein [Metabacillus malikii]|uniref:Uncharacterized protein n=1 Tax=Metabacillus malikii TaxID=1504265 RepID=A0ABT9ZL41_9BACI|nr:hypothetical protein [Metabacillus malikii]MDQ0233022.1 hypothetical protein [Metabacillus malikii]